MIGADGRAYPARPTCYQCGYRTKHPRTACAWCVSDIAANLETHRYDPPFWARSAVRARRASGPPRAIPLGPWPR